MCICVIAPAHDAGVGNLCRQQVSKPKDAITGCPCLLPMSIQPMDCDNTSGLRLVLSVVIFAKDHDVLDHWVDAFGK